MSCDVGCRRGSDLALLWLWGRPVATAPIRLLAFEPPNAAGAALKRQKKKKKKNFFRVISYVDIKLCSCIIQSSENILFSDLWHSCKQILFASSSDIYSI